MPVIIVKDYEWRQTSDKVIIQVQVNVTPNNVNLFVLDNYMKAHYKPFILELFLWDSIEDEESLCTIGNKELIFTLKKRNTDIEWPSLETLDLTKELKMQRRNCAFEAMQNLNIEKSKKKSEKKRDLQRQAVQAQLNLHNEQITKIEDIKNSCRKKTMDELDEWSQTYANPYLEIENKKDTNMENKDESIEKKEENDDFNIWDDYDSDNETEENSASYRPGAKTVREIITRKREFKKKINESGQSVPLPRQCRTIDVTFSERVFVTPARESFKEQEEEWLTKQAKARRNVGFVAEDLRPEEQDPEWCLDKGEDFLKVGNHLGAISAFSHGIKLNDKMETLYIMRSVAHYKAENFQRCIADASKALELMVPECESNREARARCFARRGAAFCQLSAPQHGLPELEAALKLLPNDEQIISDIRQIKQHFNLN